MTNILNGAIWTGILVTLVGFIDQHVPNSLSYWIDVYVPFI